MGIETVGTPIDTGMGTVGIPINLTDARCYPLVIHGENEKWSVSFRSRPNPGIEATGVSPRVDEILDALKFLPGAPVVLVDMIIAAHAAATRQEINEGELEGAYWEFDARRKGYGRWRDAPMAERDAFKTVVRNLLSERKGT